MADIVLEARPDLNADLSQDRIRQDDVQTEEMLINMGPQHPATHGVFRMVLTVDGEQVVDVDPIIGYMHRGAEKLSENCDYRQAIGYQDRTDYLGQFNTELCYVEAVEKLAGIEPPERAEYIRVILAELNRIASHLLAFGTYGMDLGAITPFLHGFRDREKILKIFEKLCGQRLNYTYVRVGGVWRYVYRAVDQHGHVIDVLVSKRRNVPAATKFFEAMLAGRERPREVTTDLAAPLLRVVDDPLPTRSTTPRNTRTTGSSGTMAGSRRDCGRCAVCALIEVRRS